MIPSAAPVATIESTFEAETHQFGFAEDAFVHLAMVLSNLYSDVEASVLRELIVNALDSHIEAGQTRPVEISTPTMLSPYLKVRDFGVGMGHAELVQVYTKYGASTKRNSNATTGSLGLGSKSPLAYTSSFSVKSIKDGERLLLSISIDAQGIPVMEIVDRDYTTEDNGVEITIPAKRNNDFEHKAREFAKFVKPGLLLVNNKDYSLTMTKITDRIYAFEANDYRTSDVVIMGNVAYPVHKGIGGDIAPDNQRLAAFIDMASVNFTPSREELMDTDLTRSTLDSIREEYISNIKAAITADIESAATPAEAFARRHKWTKIYRYGGSKVIPNTYHGQTMPTGHIKRADGTYVTATRWEVNSPRHSVSSSVSVAHDSIVQSMCIVNYPYSGTVSSNNKAKIRKWMEDNDSKVKNVLLFTGATVPGDPWAAPAHLVDWADIKAIRLNVTRARTGGGYSRMGGYDVWDGKHFTLNHDLKPTDEIIYLSPTEERVSGSRWQYSPTHISVISKYLPNKRIVCVAANRKDKLLRSVKSSVHVSAALNTAVNKAIAAVTQDEIKFYRARSRRVPNCLTHMTPAQVALLHDAELVMTLQALSTPRPASLDTLFSMRYNSKVSDFLDKIATNLDVDFTSRYPLATDTYSRVPVEDVVIYVNAKYDTINKKGK